MARIWVQSYRNSKGVVVKGHYRNVPTNDSGLKGKEAAILKKWHEAYNRNESAFEQNWPRAKARKAARYFNKVTKQLKAVRSLSNRRQNARMMAGMGINKLSL